MSGPGKLGRNWRAQIREAWGIRTVDPPWLPPRQALWTTRCCKLKGRDASATPEVMYRAPLPQRFMARMAELGYPFAILSDLYGLHFAGEVRAPYDLHPTHLCDRTRQELGLRIAAQFRATGHEALVFFNDSPLRSRPYFEILSHASIPTYFVTRLPDQ